MCMCILRFLKINVDIFLPDAYYMSVIIVRLQSGQDAFRNAKLSCEYCSIVRSIILQFVLEILSLRPVLCNMKDNIPMNYIYICKHVLFIHEYIIRSSRKTVKSQLRLAIINLRLELCDLTNNLLTNFIYIFRFL